MKFLVLLAQAACAVQLTPSNFDEHAILVDLRKLEIFYSPCYAVGQAVLKVQTWCLFISEALVSIKHNEPSTV